MRNELSPIAGAFRAQGISNEVRPLASQDLKSCTTQQVFYLGGNMRSFHSCLMRFGHNLVTNFPLPCVKVLSCTLQSWRKSSKQSSNYGRKPNLTPAQITSQCGVQCGLAVPISKARSCRRSLPQAKSSPMKSYSLLPNIWNLAPLCRDSTLKMTYLMR